MKKKSSTKKPLVSKADLDKINEAFAGHIAITNAMYQNVFREKMGWLADRIRDMITEEVNTDSDRARRSHGREITKTLNEMYKLFVEHEDNIAAMFSEKDEETAVIALFKFADKVGMFRLLYVPMSSSESKTNVISFRVYIARMPVCWCRIRSSKSDVAVSTRFTN